jgi:PHD/YefM family antitoxin component YafN of YafNO toxin-antitoxin module
MTEVTELEFEKNFDDYMERIENQKEEFLIRRADGTAVVAVPATDEYNYLWDHDDAS